MSRDDYLDAHDETQMELMDKGLKRIVVCTESDIEEIAKQVNQDLKSAYEKLVTAIKKHGAHSSVCETNYEANGVCDCWLGKALSVSNTDSSARGESG